MKRFCFITLAAFCLLFFREQVNAGILPYTNSINVNAGTFRLGDSCTVNDGLPSGHTYGFMQGVVTLGIDWTQMSFNSTYPANVPYTMEVVVVVKGWNPSGTRIVHQTETLKVHYNPVANTTELDRSIFSCTGVRRLSAVITGIKVNGIPVASSSATLPRHIFLSTDVTVDRYQAFTTSSTTTTSITSLADNQLRINWTTLTGAEEYDLEWTWVDEHAPQQYNFQYNATRITLPSSYGTSYKLPMLYPSGTIVVRVRGRGRDLSVAPDFSRVTYGDWNIASSGTLSSLTANVSKYVFSTGLEELKNWQSTYTFSENGKRKEAVSYYDGTLRSRQNVARLNSDSVAIVGQTFYDHAGRPMIQVLPVPSQETGGVNNNRLEYRPKFNRDNGGNAFTIDDFDMDSASCQGLIVHSMSNTYGASKYYSPQNTLKNNQNGNPHNYIPDASGYPYSQVEYMPDNTGRVRRQGSIGPNHRLSGVNESGSTITGKETRYYYATPFQAQLDRLFGNEVGYYKHYKKNAVIDANGQVSITYMDPYGRVIATALAGDTANTPSLEPLPSASVSTDLTVSLIDSMNIDYTDMSLTAVSTHLVTSAGDHVFRYSVATPSFTNCLPPGWCFDCIYDLTMSIKDECGTEMITNGPLRDTVGNVFNVVCDSVTYIADTGNLRIYLEPGTYVVSKKLSVNRSALDYYTAQYLANSPCITPLDSFLAEELAMIDTTECYGGCDECLARLGSYSEHNDTSRINDPQYDYLTQDEYDEAVAKCGALCEVKTTCDALYRQIIADVSPGGQYAEYTIDLSGSTPVYAATDSLSLLNVSGGMIGNYTQLPYYQGLATDTAEVTIGLLTYHPQNLPLSEFVLNWQPQWAEQLAPYHPEYCYYQFCLSHEDSYLYDMNMLSTATFEAARDSGFLNPIASNTNTTDFPVDHKDPYFYDTGGSQRNPWHFLMSNELASFSSGSSAWDIIGLMQANNVNASTGDPGCWTDYDWAMFRGLYLSAKQSVMKIEILNALPGCPGFGSYPNDPFTLQIKQPRYIFDAFGALQNDSLTGNSIDVDSSSSPSDIAGEASGFIDGYCDTICNAYSEEWMWQLDNGCGLLDADSAEIRARLVNQCRSNCNAGNPLGGLERTEVDAILADVLGPGYMNDTCNPFLAAHPLTGHSYLGMAPMDTCSCNLVLQNQIAFDTLSATGQLPAGICSAQDLFINTYGTSMGQVDLTQLACFCLARGWIAEDSVVTTTSAGPVTTVVSPQCESILGYYEAGDTITAAEYMTDLVLFFNRHWERDSCSDLTTFMLADLNLPLNFLNRTPSDCFLSYSVENTYITDTLYGYENPVNQEVMYSCQREDSIVTFYGDVYYLNDTIYTDLIQSQRVTFHNPCGEDCEMIFSAPACLSGDLACASALYCQSDLQIAFSGQLYQDNIPNPCSGGSYSPFGPGLYTTGNSSNGHGSGKYDLWTDCFSISDTVIQPPAFDTTMMVPVGLTCRQCLNCDLIDTAYANLVADYPFVASITDTVQVIRYLTDYINEGYNLNFNYLQLIDRMALCDASAQPDTLEFCYEPPFSVVHDPHSECVDFLLATAQENAEMRYNEYIDSVEAAFRNAYITRCMSPLETLTMQYKEREFHYTLYYYDQGGNLIKTVPPAGVHPLTTQAALDSAQHHRLNPVVYPTRVLPRHTQITDYKYNTLNQPSAQHTPDGGKTEYWYDVLGRVVASRNARQSLAGTYSYTIYDELGRVREVGELDTDTPMTTKRAADPTAYTDWFIYGTRSQVTTTVYDETLFTALPFTGNVQKNLRNRVAYISYEESYNSSDTLFDVATHFSYDIHGNVQELVHEDRSLRLQRQQYKHLIYTYDLISGNVLMVHYQPGKKDRFFHKYSYDADNRLQTVKVSRDSVLWETDAQYTYYRHGPLARVELGDNKVQGLDYAYTLHGWLKGMNGNTLVQRRDIGADGNTGTHRGFNRDAAGFSLGYYEEYGAYPSDYTSIRTFGPDTFFLASTTSISGNVVETSHKDLFNGNISYMVTGLPNCSTYNASKTLSPDPMATVYRYDQLNRLTGMRAFLDAAYLATNNRWNTTSSNGGLTYGEQYAYDPNGNILQLYRKGDQSGGNLMMDSMTYAYATSSDPFYSGQGINRLGSITENQNTAARYSGDLDNDATYSYDAIGNLTADSGEEIADIEWNVYGKVRKVVRTTGSLKPDLEFRYDAAGKRILKIEKPRNASGVLNQSNWTFTRYRHDAQGNIMAIYTTTYITITENKYEEFVKVRNFILYGSSRIGMKEDTTTLSRRYIRVQSYHSDSSFNSVQLLTNYTMPAPDNSHVSRYTGNKQFEIANHLGNVISTVTDRKIQESTSPYTIVRFWNPDMHTVTDYYPFGAPMPGRNLSMPECYTTVTTDHDTLVNETFASGTGGFTAVNGATLTNVGGAIRIQRTTASTNWGAAKTFSMASGKYYTATFQLDVGSCITSLSNYILVRIKNPSGTVIDSRTYSSSGAYSFGVVANGTGTGSIEVLYGSPSKACSFNLYDMLVYTTEDIVSTVCESDTSGYVFGFNGQLKDNEVYGEGNAYSFEYRIHDPRIGRFLSVDPLARDYPYNSPYAFCENTPIAFRELEGLEKVPANEVWDLSDKTTSASNVYGNYNKDAMYVLAKVDNQVVTLHQIRSGPNKGNYVGIVHNGNYANFWRTENRDKNYSYEERYVVGKEIVEASRDGRLVLDRSDIAKDGLAGSGKYSEALFKANLANWIGQGYWDDETGEWVSADVYESMVNGWVGIVTDPTNYLPSPSIKARFRSVKSLDDWHTFRKQNKGVYTKKNYGTSAAANTARKTAFDGFNPAEVDIEFDKSTIPTQDDKED